MTPSSIGVNLNDPNYTYEPAFLPLQVTLAANAPLVDQVVGPLIDADFVLTGIHGTSTGKFTANLRLPSGRYLSTNAQIQSANFMGTPQEPTDFPPTVYPMGGQGLKIAVTDTSGAGNTIEIICSGYNRRPNQG